MVKVQSQPQSPTIDTAETRWAARQVADLIRQVGPDSVAGMILGQAERELKSLVPEPAEVIGPLRVRMAA